MNSLHLRAQEIENDLPSSAHLVTSICDASNMNSEANLNVLCETVRFILKGSCNIRHSYLPCVYHSNSSAEFERYRSFYEYRNIPSDVEEKLNWLHEVRTIGEFFPGRQTVRPSVYFGSTARAKNTAGCNKNNRSLILILQEYSLCSVASYFRSY